MRNIRVTSNLRPLLLAIGACSLVGCSTFSRETDAAVTGEEVGDVNWAFANIEAMEVKVASLETENAALKQQLTALQRRLAEARTTAEVAVAKADVLAEREQASGFNAPVAKPAADPVISAPDPDVDLTDGNVEVENAPRLIQPSFASSDRNFENEATADVSLSSVLWGVHLDSYSKERFAREGWRRLQRTHPNELGLLEPRTEKVAIEGRGEVYRLIGGGFTSEVTAKALCAELSAKSQYCRVVTFGGQRLSLVTPGKT